ncbi:MFS transporter [Streptomyces sp. NPDC005727]|uniref:MFS transporter n=1 Tax=Streptomyces sp. NPDC005727 TaxID=3157053 RepID=UPI0033F0E5C2
MWQGEIGFSKGTLTVVFAAYIVGLTLSLLTSGVVSDRLGRRSVMIPALGSAVIACVAFATASSVAALLVARLCTGIAVGTIVSAGMAAVSDVAGPERRRLGALFYALALTLLAVAGGAVVIAANRRTADRSR